MPSHMVFSLVIVFVHPVLLAWAVGSWVHLTICKPLRVARFQGHAWNISWGLGVGPGLAAGEEGGEGTVLPGVPTQGNRHCGAAITQWAGVCVCVDGQPGREGGSLCSPTEGTCSLPPSCTCVLI